MREYFNNQGRWMSPDPAGMAAVNPMNPQTWNRYAYVGGNPLSNVDPTGLGPLDGVRVPLNIAPPTGGAGGVNPASQSSLAGLLDPGAAFINSAIQDFYAQAGWNSQIQQAVSGWYQSEVDAGFNALQPGTGPSQTPPTTPDDDYHITVYCGGSLSDITCLPPLQAVSNSVAFSTNILTPGVGPIDIPAPMTYTPISPYAIPGTQCSAGCHPEPFTPHGDGRLCQNAAILGFTVGTTLGPWLDGPAGWFAYAVGEGTGAYGFTCQ